MFTKFTLIAALAVFTGAFAFVDPPATTDAWKDWEFLIGDWVGEGGGKPGEGVGGFTFKTDLAGKILVRRNRSDYPAAGGRPATSHEDLMVIYPDPASKRTRAVYFDNEGHVIHYTVKLSKKGQAWTFTSDKSSVAPQFRLTYTKKDKDNVDILFEMAQGDQKKFTTYTKGTAHRK